MEQTNWYAIYTAPRAEKSVKKRLDQAGIESYLSLRIVERERDGQVRRVEVPLVSGYVFVRVVPSDFIKVLSIQGVLAFLREHEIPTVISEQQIRSLRLLDNYADDVEIVEGKVTDLSIVRVTRGKLSGLVAERMDDGDPCRILVRVPNVGGVVTMVPADCVEASL